jgi:hypothetical protein
MAHFVQNKVGKNLVYAADFTSSDWIAVGVGGKEDEAGEVCQKYEDHVRGNVQKDSPNTKNK